MTRIFHITHLDNLPRIIEREEICCDRTRDAEKLEARNIGYAHIKERRKVRVITRGPGGFLWEYTPFYFAPRSPMLYTINQGNVPGYDEGQEPVVHLVAKAEAIKAGGLGFVFTNGHAEIQISEQFEDLTDLGRIDWDIMEADYWADTEEDNDRLRRRQAEFLVHGACPWELIEEVAVMTDSMAKKVSALFSEGPNVVVRPDWYY